MPVVKERVTIRLRDLVPEKLRLREYRIYVRVLANDVAGEMSKVAHRDVLLGVVQPAGVLET
jgi:hypothetical protein